MNNKADILFSQYIRMRDRACMFRIKCAGEATELHACHFHRRGKWTVRYDPQNADAGCPVCHDYIDNTAEGIKWHREFKERQLGTDAYDMLGLRANRPGRKDKYREIKYCKELLEGIINENSF